MVVEFIFPGFFLALLAALVILGRHLYRTSQGVQRKLVLAPFFILVGWGLVIFISVTTDPTSHNLWPFEMMMGFAGTLAYLLLVLLFRKFTKPPQS